jgi:hypothetical protein
MTIRYQSKQKRISFIIYDFMGSHEGDNLREEVAAREEKRF